MTKVLRSQYNLLKNLVSDVIWKKTKIVYEAYVKRWITTYYETF